MNVQAARLRRRRATRTRSKAMRGGLPLLVAGAAGAALAFFLDREQGKRRRHVLRDRFIAAGRRGARRAERRADYAASTAEGMRRRAGAKIGGPPREYDDVTLARKVETELFRPADAPKGSVSVNAQHGVVELRGQVTRPEQVAELGEAAARIEGVERVDNLLHTAGSPPKHSPVSAPDEVRERAEEPRAPSRFSRNPATTPPKDEPMIERAPGPEDRPGGG